MKNESKINFPIIYYIIYLFIPYTISNLFGIALEVDMISGNKFKYTILIAVAIKILNLFPLLLALMSVLCIIGIIVLNYYYAYRLKALVEWIWQFLWNITQYVQGKERVLKGNVTVLWIILVILLCIFTYWALFKIKRPLFLVPGYYSFFIYYWYVYIDEAYEMMIVFTFAIIILFSLRVYEKEKYRFEYRSWLKITICYGIIAILAGAMLPKGDNLLHWPWLENKIYNYFPAIGSMRADGIQSNHSKEGSMAGIFSLWETGFNPEGSRLGGPVKLNNSEVMTVKSPYPIYLRGRISEVYKQNQWTTGKWNKNRLWVNTNLPSRSKEETIEIFVTYSNLSSNTLFAPYMPIAITDIGSKIIFVNENNQIIVPTSIYKNQVYRVVSILPSAEGRFEMERRILTKYYLQLPSSISKEVYQLSKTITQDKPTKYEKALAIKDYLRKNYRYSLDVSHIPKGKEFVDYFLFEEKEGYCTYFATAMAVLLRAEGIPSRYVEGYRMPQESKNGVYTITQEHAHAWVEAYIEGQGWITLDSTPSQGTPNILDNSSINTNMQYESFSDELFQDETLNIIGPNNTNLKLNQLMNLEKEMNSLENHTRKFSELFNVWKVYILVLIFLSMLFWLLINASISYFRRRKYIRRLKRLSTNDSSINLYNDIIIMLEHLGYIRNNGETPYEYAKRIAPRIYDYKVNFKDVTELYLKAKYSNIEVSMEEKDIFVNYHNYIEKKLKIRLGKWRYMYYKYFSYK